MAAIGATFSGAHLWLRNRNSGGVMDIEKLLDQVDLFSVLSAEQRNNAVKYFEWARIDKGCVLIKEGEKSNFAILVISGCFEVIKDVGGAQKLLSLAKPGVFLGELGLVSGEARYASCRAAKDSVVGMLSQESFEKMMIESPDIYSGILARLCHVMGRRLIQVNDTVLRLQENQSIAVAAAKQILESTQ